MNKVETTSSKILLTLAALIVVMAGIKAASPIIVPFLLSIFIAIICNPLLKWGKQFRLPEAISISLIVVIILVVGLSLAGIVGASVNDFSQQLPEYKAKLTDNFSWLIGQLAAFNIHLNRELIMEHFDPGVAMGMVSTLLSGVGGVMANLFLIVLTVIFMLLEATTLPQKVHLALNDPAMKLRQIDKFISSVNQYLAIKTVVSIGTGTLAGLLCWIVGVDHFVLWGVLAFLLNYIPNIGSIIAAIPAVLLALVDVGGLGAAIIAGGYVAINTLMGNVVEPRYMGKGLGLSTMVVFLSLVFWGWLLGTVGMLLSVPLTMIVKIGLESSRSAGWVSVMLSDSASVEHLTSENDSKTGAA
jgi:AI-2 transport protein TqsA